MFKICIAISINVHILLNAYRNTINCFIVFYIVPLTSKYAEYESIPTAF